MISKAMNEIQIWASIKFNFIQCHEDEIRSNIIIFVKLKNRLSSNDKDKQ